MLLWLSLLVRDHHHPLEQIAVWFCIHECSVLQRQEGCVCVCVKCVWGWTAVKEKYACNRVLMQSDCDRRLEVLQ